jgi:hypothetical protein
MIASVAPTIADGASLWYAIVFDADNGASGKTAYFFTSTNGTTWTPHGVPDTAATATAVFVSTAPLVLSGFNTNSTHAGAFNGKINYVSVRQGWGRGRRSAVLSVPL